MTGEAIRVQRLSKQKGIRVGPSRVKLLALSRMLEGVWQWQETIWLIEPEAK